MLIDKIANRNPYKFVNPIEKFIFSVGLLLLSSISKNLYLSILNIIFINIFLIILVKISFKELFSIYKIVFLFMVMTNISLAFVHKDYLTISINALSSISIMYFLFCTTPITQIGELMLLFKIPKIIVELFLLTYRFIFLFIEIKNQMINSQNSRLGNTNVKNSFYSFSLLVSNLFNKIFILSEKTNMSIISRMGEEFLFLRNDYKANKNFRYLFIYLIFAIMVVSYGKI